MRGAAILEIEKHYIVDQNNRKIAVQISIETFEKIERLLEDYALAQMMLQVEEEPTLDLEAAKREYQKLPDDS